MMDEIQDYNYSRLKTRLIRLLQLRESDACIDKEDVLQGTLKQISLDSSEPFDAISYACGPPVYSECILIDGKKVFVTKNCRDALRHLRNQFGVRTVWVDAVCINRSDDSEKSGQIRLMTDIYGKARRVYIWLGDQSQDSAADRALDWLQDISVDQYPLLGVRLGNFPKNMHPREVIKALRIIPDIFRASIRRLGLAPAVDAMKRQLGLGSVRPEYDRAALADIIGRPWFKRIWTVQEAAMAGEPFVVCGTRKIRWNHFFWGIVEACTRVDDSMRGELSAILDSIYGMHTFWLEISTALEFAESKHRKWLPKDSALFEKWIAFLNFMEEYGLRIFRVQLAGIAAMVMIRLSQGLRPLNYIPLAILCCVCAATLLLTPPKMNVRWDDNLRHVFINVLNKSRNQESTDPKDKVYAVYGLLQRLDIRLPEPDYSNEHSLEDTYLGFTHSIIQWHCSLDILLEASGPWGHNAPSWVPDWSRSYQRVQYSEVGASTGSSPQTHDPPCTFSKNLRELTVSGKRVGKVVLRTGPIERLVILDVNESSIPSIQVLIRLCKNVTTLRKWLRAVTDDYPLSVDEICNFLASISTWQGIHTAGEFQKWAEVMLNDDLTIPSNEILSFLNVSVSVELGRRIAREICSHDPPSAGPEWRILLTLAIDDKLWRLHQNICSMLAKTISLFVAQANNSYLLGAGANCIQDNDTIALLPTLKTPMIVRGVKDLEGKFHLMGAAHIPRLLCARTWPEGGQTQNELITLI